MGVFGEPGGSLLSMARWASPNTRAEREPQSLPFVLGHNLERVVVLRRCCGLPPRLSTFLLRTLTLPWHPRWWPLRARRATRESTWIASAKGWITREWSPAELLPSRASPSGGKTGRDDPPPQGYGNHSDSELGGGSPGSGGAGH